MDRYDEVAANMRLGIRAGFRTLVEVAGLDEDRARAWVIVRTLLNAAWTIQDAQRTGRDLDSDERARLTGCIAIAKAVQN